MEVLAWLDDRSFEWDMYVDLPAGAVRYCFRTSEDATAFKRRFVQSQRQLSAAAIDHGWRTRSLCRPALRARSSA